MVRDAARRAGGVSRRTSCSLSVLEAFLHAEGGSFDPSRDGALGSWDHASAEYGGAGINHVSYGLIARELERVAFQATDRR